MAALAILSIMASVSERRGPICQFECRSSRNGVLPGDTHRVRALAAYKDFLAVWKDADPDIPVPKEAKSEYAKLQ